MGSSARAKAERGATRPPFVRVFGPDVAHGRMVFGTTSVERARDRSPKPGIGTIGR
ncbi:MAG: hypothetical protein AVDCRST_MAG78-1623 [uncultured Rubrobacteraceae bacterium]|uniref:Uncharacterized protein n=1 Tax=uncultured Rubrobacteraceae bacterium TaxID=349277 RepID=A0A6J4Q409_9ACTN|nr:MAG: hypothetical protein AVDCRST_MAG78-1623 [uncultured Rubrobacteraceae bacterium]